jgi:hypothetical protein
MPDDKPDPETQRIIASLGDGSSLRQQGVNDQWIDRCAELVSEWQQLQRRFRELEARLSDSDEPGSQDTIVF